MLLRPQLNCVALYHAEIFYRVAQWHPLLESLLSSSLSAEVSFRVARQDVVLNSYFSEMLPAEIFARVALSHSPPALQGNLARTFHDRQKILLEELHLPKLCPPGQLCMPQPLLSHPYYYSTRV